MGTPVVGTNFGGIKNVIKDGVNGLLYPNEQPSELAEKIRLLLEDKDLREQCITEGKKTALEEYSIERTISHYEAFFEQLITR